MGLAERTLGGSVVAVLATAMCPIFCGFYRAPSGDSRILTSPSWLAGIVHHVARLVRRLCHLPPAGAVRATMCRYEPSMVYARWESLTLWFGLATETKVTMREFATKGRRRAM